jgi:hypothetical protein
VGIQPMPGFHGHDMYAPELMKRTAENSSRQPRPAVLVSVVIQTLSLLRHQTCIAQCKSCGIPIGNFENLSDDNHVVHTHHV